MQKIITGISYTWIVQFEFSHFFIYTKIILLWQNNCILKKWGNSKNCAGIA